MHLLASIPQIRTRGMSKEEADVNFRAQLGRSHLALVSILPELGSVRDRRTDKFTLTELKRVMRTY